MNSPSAITEADAAPMIAACPLGCAAALRPTAIVVAEGPLRACPRCTLLVSNCTRQQYAAALAKWDTDAGTQPDPRSAARFRQLAQRRLALGLQVLGRVPKPRLLDVGCSSGSLLTVARDMGFAVAGVEAAPAAAASARRAGFDVFTGTLQQAPFAPGQFDIITLIELLEHVADPLGLLRHCNRLLGSGGVVVLNTPNAASWTARVLGAGWEGFNLGKLGGHLCFYSPAALRTLAVRTGFDIAVVATRNLRLAEAGAVSPAMHKLSKLAAELLALPARWAGAGHDLLAVLRRSQSAAQATAG